MGNPLSFLEAAAQIIPVIFLALAVQNFFPSLRPSEAKRLLAGETQKSTELLEQSVDSFLRALPEDQRRAKAAEIQRALNEELERRDEEVQFRVERSQQWAGAISAVVMFLMLLGEAAALVGLDRQEPTFGRAVAAGIAIGAGGTALMYSLARSQFERIWPDKDWHTRTGLILTVASALVLAVWVTATAL